MDELNQSLAYFNASEEKYHNLPAKASDCIACGACVKRCPFAIDVMKNMERARNIFGE